MTMNVVACKLPSEMVNTIDRLAAREHEPRSAWMRRVLIAELRRLESEHKAQKDASR